MYFHKQYYRLIMFNLKFHPIELIWWFLYGVEAYEYITIGLSFEYFCIFMINAWHLAYQPSRIFHRNSIQFSLELCSPKLAIVLIFSPLEVLLVRLFYKNIFKIPLVYWLKYQISLPFCSVMFHLAKT